MTVEQKANWAAKMAVISKSPEYRAKCSAAHKLRCSNRTPEERAEFAKKISEAKKGKGNGLTGRKWSIESRLKLSESAKRRGKNHNFYVDGKGQERDTERRWAMKGIKYRLWREAVFERDDFTCQICGVRGGVTLHADHILRWKEHPKLRFDVSNGRTLCEPCHLNSATFGNKPQ